MMTDRGLRHVQLIRGARQAAGLDDPNKVAKLAQIHDYLRIPLSPLFFARLFEVRE